MIDRFARFLIRRSLPGRAGEELSQPPPSSFANFRKVRFAFAIIIGCSVTAASFSQDARIGAAVFGVLALLAMIYPIRQSRKRHLEYEAMIVAEREKDP